MEANLNKPTKDLLEVFGINKKRADEIAKKMDMLIDIDNVSVKNPADLDFQKTFDILQSIAETPGEEVFMCIAFGKLAEISMQFIKRDNIRKEIIKSRLPQN